MQVKTLGLYFFAKNSQLSWKAEGSIHLRTLIVAQGLLPSTLTIYYFLPSIAQTIKGALSARNT